MIPNITAREAREESRKLFTVSSMCAGDKRDAALVRSIIAQQPRTNFGSSAARIMRRRAQLAFIGL